MPYFTPGSSFVLWSTIYLLTIGVIGLAASRISAYRQQFQVSSNESYEITNMQGMELPTKNFRQSRAFRHNRTTVVYPSWSN